MRFMFLQAHLGFLASSRLFMFLINQSCSDDSFWGCGRTRRFFAQDVRSLRASICTHFGFGGFVSLFVQENQNFHCSFSFNICHFVDADRLENTSIMELPHLCMCGSNTFSSKFIDALF